MTIDTLPLRALKVLDAVARLGSGEIGADEAGVARELDGSGDQHRNQSKRSNQNFDQSHSYRLLKRAGGRRIAIAIGRFPPGTNCPRTAIARV